MTKLKVKVPIEYRDWGIKNRKETLGSKHYADGIPKTIGFLIDEGGFRTQRGCSNSRKLRTGRARAEGSTASVPMGQQPIEAGSTGLSCDSLNDLNLY